MLLIWLDNNMTWLTPYDGSPRRPSVFSDAAIQYYLSIMLPFKLPFWQAAGMIGSLLRLAELAWPVVYYSILRGRQKTRHIRTLR